MANPNGSWFECQCPVEKRHLAAVFKHDASIKEFDELERSMLTDTSILQWMGRQHPPTTTNSSQIQPLLRHLTTLLTCGDENDADSKKKCRCYWRLDR